MSIPTPTPNFENWRALILHRPHGIVQSIKRQLDQIGMAAETFWPELPKDIDASQYNIIFFDADMGHDEQFPWAEGAAPMPTIALIGSEAPGRVAWAIRRGADAHLLKPIGSGGIYSAVFIASQAFDRRKALGVEADNLRNRLSSRECLAEATAQIMLAENIAAEDAYRKLRLLAMSERKTIEAMAEHLLQQNSGGRKSNDRA